MYNSAFVFTYFQVEHAQRTMIAWMICTAKLTTTSSASDVQALANVSYKCITIYLKHHGFAAFSNRLNCRVCSTIADCRGFNEAEFQDLCPAQSAVYLTTAAYEFGDRHICKQKETGDYIVVQDKDCEKKDKELSGEDCSAIPECKDKCQSFYTDVFNASPYPDAIPIEEVNGVIGQLQGLKKHWGKADFILFKNLNGQPFAYTAYVGSTIVIVFKGTSDDADGIADANFLPTKFKVSNDEGTTVEFSAHLGFVKYYEALQKLVLDAVEELSSVIHQNGQEVEELLVAGHSLGGAMANLCALDLALKYPEVTMNLFTFGAPRVFHGNTKDTTVEGNSAFHGDELVE